jgi:hypothetical protein
MFKEIIEEIIEELPAFLLTLAALPLVLSVGHLLHNLPN